VKTSSTSQVWEVQAKHTRQLALLASLVLFPSILALAQQSATSNVRSTEPLSELAHSYDITTYGARAVTRAPSTTASCNATRSVAIESAVGFQIGDGVVIYGCGPPETMSTPSVPTVTPGVSDTLTVPDAVLTTDSSGSTTYSYKIMNRDKFGGLTLPSSPTTITTGPAKLGENQLTVSSISLSGNTVTVVMSARENLKAGELIHITGSTNGVFELWANVGAITSGTRFTITNFPMYSAAGISATGGTLTYYTGNQLTWTNSGTTPWQTIVCRSGPSDRGDYHVIGLTWPVNSVAHASNRTFTDWGYTLTTAPRLPSYISDSACTAASARNDYLSTTITKISGNTLTVANAASQTNSGQTLLQDSAPGIKAAFTHAAVGNLGPVLIPAPASAGIYYINSFLDLSSYTGIPLRQEGAIQLGETMEPPYRWTGATSGHCCGPTSFGLDVVGVGIDGAWPGVYANQNIPLMENLSFGNAGNQSLLVFLDGFVIQGGILDKLVFNTGSTGDYTGMGLVVRGNPFFQSFKNLVFQNGPGNGGGNLDTTWTPMMYFARNTSGSNAAGVGSIKMENLQFNGRTFMCMDCAQFEIKDIYTQGNILPTITVDGITGFSGTSIIMSGVLTNDTSGQAMIATIGGIGATIYLQGVSGLSSGSTSGVPPQITGASPRAVLYLNDAGELVGPGFGSGQSNSTPIDTIRNSMSFDAVSYYANDYQDAGNFNLSRGIFQNAGPVSSNSGMFVPLATPILSVPKASSGGLIADGGHIWCVNAVGFHGGWSKSSCQYFTVVGANRTLTFDWAPVIGAQGYVLSRDGVQCLPDANATCRTLTAAVGTTSFVYSDPGSSPGGIAAKTAAGDGSNGFDASGHFGLMYSCPETTAPTGVAAFDILYCDSSAHAVKEVADSGSAYLLTRTIASGTSPLGTTSIPSGGCAATVTGSATGAASTDSLIINDNASDLSGVRGYGVNANGNLTIYRRITPGRVNFTVCNSTRSTITPGMLTLQWKVVR
jgi:hypothetical protein